MTDGGEEGRYLILGTIDGLLAVLGIIIGLSAATSNADIIVRAALGGGIALCLTNGVGSYLAETAVVYGRISSVEHAMLETLRDTHIEKQAKRKIMRDSIIHGGTSLVGSIIPVVPFLFLHDGSALYVAIGLCAVVLIGLGLYSGHVSKQSYIKSVVRMIGLGALIVIICSLLGLE
jgi:predicted membrane protein (TIGR00267 family)